MNKINEIEVKYLNINLEAVVEKLEKLGATKVGDFVYKRQVMDFPGFLLDKKAAWLRIRDEGGKIFVAYKQRQGWEGAGCSGQDCGMIEIEMEVNGFDKAVAIFSYLGMIKKHYVENKRTRYFLDGVELDIDTWPLLKPYLEIEADDEEKIKKVVGRLGLDINNAKVFSTTQIYELEGINQLEYESMTFSECVKREK